MTGRPLSKDFNALEDLYKTRAALYEKFADYKAANNGGVNAAVEEIMQVTSNRAQVTSNR